LAFDRFAAKVLGKEESNMRAKLACDNFQVDVSIFERFGVFRTADWGCGPRTLCGGAAPMCRSKASVAVHCLRDASVAKRNSLR
jgi:hypothetical protein